MKVILVNGEFDGHRMTVDDPPPDEIRIVRWKVSSALNMKHPYIRPGYKMKYVYLKQKAINLGNPIVYYTYRIPQVANLGGVGRNDLLRLINHQWI